MGEIAGHEPAELMAILKLPEVDLFYEESGAGHPVLFIQGIGVAGEGWRPQVDGLKEVFQTVHFDHRGLGRSGACRGPITIEAMAEDARGLLEAVGWESAHVVGHSMGGVIAQQLALQHSRRVRSLALLCTVPRGKDAVRLTPWVLWMTFRTRLGPRRWRRRAFLEMLWPPEELRTVDAEALAAQLARLLERDLAEQPPIVMKQVRALARHDASARLGELGTIPTLVLSAEHDPIAPPRFGEQLAAAIPGARFERMAHTSHGCTIQKAAEVNARLQQFIEAVERERTAKAQ